MKIMISLIDSWLNPIKSHYAPLNPIKSHYILLNPIKSH